MSILENYLKEFKGCVIIVSHDRFFLDNTVDRVFAFEGNGIVKDFPGNYTDYRLYKSAKEESEKDKSDVSNQKEKNITWKNVDNNKKRLTYLERREFESLEAEIEELTTEKNNLEKLFSNGELNSEQLEAASQRYQFLKSELDEKELRWLELSEKS